MARVVSGIATESAADGAAAECALVAVAVCGAALTACSVTEPATIIVRVIVSAVVFHPISMQSSPDRGCGLESYLSAERSSPARHYCAPREWRICGSPAQSRLGVQSFAKHCRLGIHCCRQPSGELMDPVQQGDVSLLQHPASQELLRSKIPARLAYVWTDGSPRVVPIWFHWNGRELVMASPPKAPKLKALASNPKVAITIDDNTFPHKVLLIRGTAKLENVSGIVPEYEAAASRYFDAELAKGWLTHLRGQVTSMVRITVTPQWVGLLDFQTRFPSALAG